MHLTNHRFILFFFTTLMFLTGCNYVQIMHINTYSNNSIFEKSANIHKVENDSLSIRFFFWSDGGLLQTAFENKLSKPLYLDWKKSSLIVNDIKLNFWEDQLELYKSDYYNNFLVSTKQDASSIGITYAGTTYSFSKTFKPERITFIPPKSIFPKASFKLWSPDTYMILSNYKKDIIYNKNYYYEDFTTDNTPSRFRFFSTYSLTEGITNEKYFDVGFYISRIENIPTKIFKKHFNEIKAANKFYFYLPKGTKGIKGSSLPYKIYDDDPIYN